MKPTVTVNRARDYIIEKNGYLFYLRKESNIKKNKKTLISNFISTVQRNMVTADRKIHSKPIDLANLHTFTFLVVNNGKNPVVSQVEMSPDGVTWESFGDLELTVLPGQKQIIVPQFFLRYVRIMFKNKNPGFNSFITIWFQGQR